MNTTTNTNDPTRNATSDSTRDVTKSIAWLTASDLVELIVVATAILYVLPLNVASR